MNRRIIFNIGAASGEYHVKILVINAVAFNVFPQQTRLDQFSAFRIFSNEMISGGLVNDEDFI